MGRPDQAGVVRPRGDERRRRARAPPTSPSRRMLQGEGWDKGWTQLLADRRQLRRDHRAQLRRARRRQQRPVRHRPGDRLLRPRRQVLGLPGRVRLPERDRRRAGQHRPGRRREERRRGPSASSPTRSPHEGQQLLLDPKISRLPVLPPSAIAARRRPAIRTRSRSPSGPRCNFDSDLSESRYYVVSSLFDQIITFRLKELQAATKAIHEAESGARRRTQRAGRRSSSSRRASSRSRRSSGRRWRATRSFLDVFTANKKDAAANKQVTGLEDRGTAGARELRQGQDAGRAGARHWSAERARATRVTAPSAAAPGLPLPRPRPLRAAGAGAGVWLAGALVLAFLLRLPRPAGGAGLRHGLRRGRRRARRSATSRPSSARSLMRESFCNSLYVAGAVGRCSRR